MLYKGNSGAEGTAFKSASVFKKALPTWAGFELKYPYENYDAHGEGMYQLVALISESDEIFNSQIQQDLTIDNALDYFLPINLLRASATLLDYRTKKIIRGAVLRTSPFRNESLYNTLLETNSFLETSKIYERAALAWPIKNQPDEALTYLNNCLEERLVFLDNYFGIMDKE